MSKRSALADILHQQGNLEAARVIFEDAEAMQASNQPKYNRLYSIQGFQYCDLLLTLGEIEAVCDRAMTTLSWMNNDPNAPLLTIAVDHLSLGCASLNLRKLEKAKLRFDLAIDNLRNAGEMEFTVRGLLLRAAVFRMMKNFKLAQIDLKEARSIARRCGMLLHECDAHLEYARLTLAEGNPDAALSHFRSADALVTECGYHRRDPEIAELKEKLGL
ncbi:MAG: hypothetical protein R3F54_32485 [Alphaproteobacteria bacterium]